MRLIDADAIAKVLNDFWLATSPREHDDKETALERAAMCRGIDDCIKYVHDSPTIGGWISVKDRLPEKKGDYLIYNTDGTVWPYWYDTSDNRWYDNLGCLTDSVTHWTPLPEPPAET